MPSCQPLKVVLWTMWKNLTIIYAIQGGGFLVSKPATVNKVLLTAYQTGSSDPVISPARGLWSEFE
jgi:hypothetical protein